MNVKEFKVNRNGKLSQIFLRQNPEISFNLFQKILRTKDVKLNGVRVSKDVSVKVGDVVCFYYKNDAVSNLVEIIYQDDNLLVVFKRRNIETVTETGDCLLARVNAQLGFECFAVHRLDRNTEGLVVFAKNQESKQQLDEALKKRTIEKFYLALVYGLIPDKEKNMIAYLKKHAEKSFVEISDKKTEGFEKIQTNYKVVGEFENSTLVEVELVTGKTHQIRAHFSHIGHFVVGDEKYGDSKVNKLFGRKNQCLCAYKIKFHFKEGALSYLDGKEIVLDKSKIDFCQNL